MDWRLDHLYWLTLTIRNYSEGKILEYSCLWHQFKTLHNNLRRWHWGLFLCFLTSSSCYSHRLTLFLWIHIHSDKIHLESAWLCGFKYLQACIHVLIDWFLGLSTSDNSNNNNNNNNSNNNNNRNNNNNNNNNKTINNKNNICGNSIFLWHINNELVSSGKLHGSNGQVELFNLCWESS